MSVREDIEKKLASGLNVLRLEVVNESNMHNVPPGSESHFKVVLVSDDFEGKTLVARHQLVYTLLDDEIRNKVHALALHTYTEDEWNQRQESAPQSPLCRGGSNA